MSAGRQSGGRHEVGYILDLVDTRVLLGPRLWSKGQELGPPQRYDEIVTASADSARLSNGRLPTEADAHQRSLLGYRPSWVPACR